MRNATEDSATEAPLSGWQVVFAAVQLRLRFILAIIVLATLAAAWPWLTSMWDNVLQRWSPFVPNSTVTAGTEFFCPMDPGVVSVWPAICPICHMDLISRNKSEALILPSGAVARMQISPYRVALAGVRTVPVRPRHTQTSPADIDNSPTANHATDQEGKATQARVDQARVNEAHVDEMLVPFTAVVHWGNETIVYVETMPGMFDGVPVQLAGREGEQLIVARGLKPDQNVVAVGTLLIDAETRLNPHLSTQYFGASAQAAASPPKSVQRAVAKTAINATEIKSLSPAEQKIVDAQQVCPVTRAQLGSMGQPILVDVNGRQVAICCEGCRGRLLANREKYLQWLDERIEATKARLPLSNTGQETAPATSLNNSDTNAAASSERNDR